MEAASVADNDRDGILDLTYCVYNSILKRMEIFRSKGESDWSFQQGKLSFAVLEESHPVVTLWTPDINRDGVPDLILNLGKPQNLLLVAFGNKDSEVWSKDFRMQNPIDVSDPENLQLTDVNGDGVNDLVLLNDRTKSIQLYIGRTNGTFMPSSRLAKAEGVAGFAITDINADLIPELILTESIDGSLRIISLKEE